MKLVELESKIKKAAQDYYDGHPTISDDAFDALVDELKRLDADNTLLKVPGWGYTPLGKKFNHYITPIGSLGKIKYVELKDKINVLPDYFRVEPKFDGGSAVCYYEGGKLIRILSRGDGVIGVDITQNLLHAVPSTIPYNKKLAVRGEIVITIENFSKMQGYKSPRNAAVGLSQSEHVDKNLVRNLRFLACEIIGYEDEDVIGDKDVTEEFEWVIPKAKTNPKSFQEYVANMKDFPKTTKLDDGKHVQIDGWVLKSFSFVTTQQGSWIKSERSFQIAFKFQEEQEVTKVKNIQYTVSRTGRVVPVWIIEPVQLAGATINRVTANNFTFLKNMKAGVGAEILISRANEVIPKIEETVTPSDDYRQPQVCPVCGVTLIEKGVDLYCPNENCPPKSIESVYRIIDKMEIDGIGRILIDTFLEENFIDSMKVFGSILFATPEDELIEKVFGKGTETSKKFYNMLDALMNYVPTISDVLLFANIPTVGDKVCEQYGQIAADEFVRIFKEDLQIPYSWQQYSVNYLNFDNIVAHRERIKDILQFFSYVVKEEQKTFGLNWKVAVTGSVKLPRDKWYGQLKQFGIEQGGVGKGTKYLVANANDPGSNKFEKAKKQGVEIVSEQKFYEAVAIELNIDANEVQSRMGI